MSDKIANTPHSTPPQKPLPASAEFLPVLKPVFHGLNWTKQANNFPCIDFQIKSLLITSIFPADSTASEASFPSQTSSSAWMPQTPLCVLRCAINYCWKHSGLIPSPFLSPLLPLTQQGRNRNLALPDTEFLTSVGDVKEQLPCAKTQILCLTGLPVSNCNKYLSLQEAWQTLHGGQPLISGAKLCYFVVQASEDLSTCLLTVLTVNQKPGPADMDQGIDSKATGISLCSVSHLSCFTLRQSPCFGKVDGGMSSTSVGSTEGQVSQLLPHGRTS